MTRIAVKNLTAKAGAKTLFRDVSFEIQPGRLVGLVGPNGAGKSSLLRAICRLAPVAAGEVTIDGAPAAKLSREALAKRIAYLPQRHVLHWRLGTRQVVALGRLPHNASNRPPSAEDNAAVDRAINRADIAGLLDRSVDSLSGGERARVMLARALAVEAPALLVDEPVAALDPFHALQIMEMLKSLTRDGRTVLVVLHDLTLAMRFCDRLLLMRDGELIRDDVSREVLEPKALGEAYRVRGVYGDFGGEPYLVPWSRLAREPEPC